MISIALLVALAPLTGQCADPDETTLMGQRLIGLGEPCHKTVPFPGVTGPASAALQTAVRRHFEMILLDAPSARWKWLPVRGDGRIYCGYVNAKNRIGGYTGFQMFMVKREAARSWTKP